MEFLKQIRAWLQGMTPKQQMMLAGGTAVTLLILWAFVALLGQPDYKTLYSGSNAADTQALTTRLDAKKIPYRLTPDGAGIQVPADQLDKARLELASGGGLPTSGRLGFEIFDKPDWMGSDFAEKVNYQRAMEGELERTIQTLAEVQAARVHIVMPKDSLFTDKEQEAKASIVLTLKRMPSQESELAIRQLVAGAVENLRPENVTLVDSTGRMLSAGNHHGGSATDGELERTLTEKLLATVEPIVGHDRVRASVNVEYDLATTEDNKETLDPNSVVALTVQKSEEIVGAGQAQSGGVPGTTSNVPSKGQPPAKPNSIPGPAQSNRTESSTYAVNRTQHHVLQPAGAIKRISAAILLDAGANLSGDQLKQVAQLSRAALDIDSSRGDTVEVQSIPFAQVPGEPVEAPSIPTQVGNVLQRWVSLLRYAGIALLFMVVYSLILRPLRKQMSLTLRQVSANLAASAPRLAVAAAGKSSLSSTVQAELDAQAQALGDPELRRAVIEKIKRDAPTAGRLIQSWVRQSSDKGR
jgi:flagellar M-ring protein FliF